MRDRIQAYEGSKRRGSAKLKLQKKWEDVVNQFDDFAHKLSMKLVNSGYTSFAMEDLHIQNMVKNHNLSQSIHNASWNRFINMLSYKAESAGMKVIKIDARNFDVIYRGKDGIIIISLSLYCERLYCACYLPMKFYFHGQRRRFSNGQED